MDAKVARDQFIRDAKSNLILDAACKVFAEKGYHETRLDDIAAAAGFSKASLYNYYEDKETLFLSLVIRMHERIIEVLKKEIQPERALTDNLSSMLRIIFSFHRENLAFFMGTTDSNSLPPVNMQGFHKHHTELMGRFKIYTSELNSLALSLFSSARKRKEFVTSLNDETIARFVSNFLRGMFIDCKMSGASAFTEADIENVINFVSKGIGVKADFCSV